MAKVNKNFLISIFILIFFSISIFVLLKNTQVGPVETVGKVENIKFVEIAGKNMKVDLALTQENQAQGLSGRISLKEDEGMLFVFNKSDKYSFWMKDMNFPIDIIWISGDLHVVYIKKNAEPESYPNTFTPSRDARYVLEVTSGFSEKNNLEEGDSVEFLP